MKKKKKKKKKRRKWDGPIYKRWNLKIKMESYPLPHV
jgi:hypothetical protein